MDNKPWYVSSSGEGLSLTLGGLSITGVAPVIEQVLSLIGHPVEPGSIGNLLTAIVTAVGSVLVVIGLLRKLVNRVLVKTA